MARLLIKCAEAPARSIGLKLGVNRFGRNDPNDFPIEDPTVSRIHCEMLLADGSLLIRDLGSTNGTFVNGRAVQEARLEAGHTIQLGAVELVVESTDVAVVMLHLEDPLLSSPALLADGSRACINHPQTRAPHRCTQCRKMFCDACVHELHRVGGPSLKLCPLCSGQCESAPVPSAAKPEKRTFMEQLRKTLKISVRGDTDISLKGDPDR